MLGPRDPAAAERPLAATCVVLVEGDAKVRGLFSGGDPFTRSASHDIEPPARLESEPALGDSPHGWDRGDGATEELQICPDNSLRHSVLMIAAIRRYQSGSSKQDLPSWTTCTTADHETPQNASYLHRDMQRPRRVSRAWRRLPSSVRSCSRRSYAARL